ncbi:MAG: sodium:solute symporter [Conexivisphaerales archaeon]
MSFNVTVVFSVFIALFLVFVFLGFYGSRFRRGNMNQLWDWALAGRRLGPYLTFFLLGADWYTAYSILSVPSAVYAGGAFSFFAVTYQAMVFAFAIFFMPLLWIVAREKGYITASDFIKDRFNSKTLSVLVALIGIAALLPYIALQIVGMQAVLASMLVGASSSNVQDISLIIAFLILAATTYTSGLRGATLGAVYKDVLIWITLLSLVFLVFAHQGGFSGMFSNVQPKYLSFSPSLAAAFSTSMLGTVLSAYLWPHNVNGSLSAQSPHRLRIGMSLAVLYAIPLALADLLGVAVYSSPAALSFLSHFPPSFRGLVVIPALAITYFPSWFVGVALLGIFVGGLVPASVMAISQGNLFARNVVKQFKPNLSDKGEATIAKWTSAVAKFGALALVFTVPATYSIQFFLVGSIFILQILPALYIGLLSNWFRREGLVAGLVVGSALGLYLTLLANKFGQITTTLYPTPLGSMYIGIIALAANLLVTIVISAAIPRKVAVTVQEPG